MDASLLMPLILVLLVVPLFLSSRKQRRMQQETQKLQKSLAVGDKVMTTSGLHATVAGVDSEDTIDLEIAPGVVTTWVRAAVRQKVEEEVPEPQDDVPAEPVVAPALEHEKNGN